MMKLDPCPSHSWWWDSHNSPKHSKWLQSNLRELDEKVKEMLTVIEEDADSFAQRAEMYYQKRPKLVNLVEEFYRAYRSLAERYDHLTGEIRQNIPRALQLQYGLSCDSPRPSGNNNGSNRHAQSSPLGKSSAHFSQSLKNPPADPSDDNAPFRTPDKIIFRKCNFNGVSEPSSSPQDKHTIDSYSSSNEDEEKRKTPDCHGPGESANPLLFDTENLSEKENENVPSYDGHSSSSDSEGGGRLTLLDRLRQEIDTLTQEKKFLADSHQDAAQRNSLLLQEMKLLQDELARSREEVQSLQSRVDELLSNNKKSSMVIFQQAEVENAEGRIHQQMDFSSGKEQEVLPILEEEYDYSAGEEELPGCHEVATREGNGCDDDDDKHKRTNSCCMQCQEMGPDVAVMIKELQDQVASLAAENENQKAAIVERGEEKKEAIRQLCFAMDVLKSRNQKLQEMLGVLMKRRNAGPAPPRRSVGEAASTFTFDWSKFFRGEWRSCRTPTVQPLTLAL